MEAGQFPGEVETEAMAGDALAHGSTVELLENVLLGVGWDAGA
jgi:hypothetical protein